LFFAESRSAVAANVVKGADRGSLIFRDDQTFTGYLRKEIVAGLGELALMPYQHPIGREYLLQLYSKNLRGNKIALRQGLRARLKSRSRFAKARSVSRLGHRHFGNCMSRARSSIEGAHAPRVLVSPPSPRRTFQRLRIKSTVCISASDLGRVIPNCKTPLIGSR